MYCEITFWLYFIFYLFIYFVICFCRELDEGIEEAVNSILWAAPRVVTDVQEFKVNYICEIINIRPYTVHVREKCLC